MLIKKINKKNKVKVINDTIKVLDNSGLVVFPSDTVYGLLVDATNENAVQELIKFKNRPPGKAISVFVSDLKMVSKIVEIGEKELITLKEILPGSFTVVLKSKHKVDPLLESENGTLGIRLPAFQFINELLLRYGRPVTATSANLASQSPHYSIESFLNSLSESKKQLIDLIIDAGRLPRNKPSTVVDLTEPEIKILRKGDADFLRTKKFISKSEEETKKIASNVILSERSESKNLAKRKPLVFIIEGELGVGKTIFVKGIGGSLGIKNIVSPTFVIYYEYGNFYHFDLYQIEEKEEFKHLGIEKLLKPGNILCFEWGEKAGEIYDLLKSKGKVLYVEMKYLSKKRRKIKVKY